MEKINAFEFFLLETLTLEEILILYLKDHALL